nr:YifB family Mg chelatase-like AAA ATPase [Gemmatimonadota bacterium]
MLAQTSSFALLGIDAVPVRVEVDVTPGLPTFTVVGLPDSAVRESRNRVAAAVANAGFDFPLRRITVNLAPGTLRKEGSAFDLPIALGILAATRQLPAAAVRSLASVGELSLTGDLHAVRGMLCVALAQRREHPQEALLVPTGNVAEARLVSGVRVAGAAHLAEAARIILGGGCSPNGLLKPAPEADGEANLASDEASECAGAGDGGEGLDLADVRGQAHAKRALEIAAAGGHNVLLIGPPGAGKSMLASRLPGILPPMSPDERLETTRIHSVVGLLRGVAPVVRQRPFRSPHHTVSQAGLVGGGSVPRPGEVSLAHNGVLFLDELPEFRREALEVLRQPLEEGSVTLSRARLSLTYPARFMLVAAMNPCPCGDLSHPHRRCRCLEAEVRRYRARVSGPLLERIDLHVDVPPVDADELVDLAPGWSGSSGEPSGTSAAVRLRVANARARQLARFKGRNVYANAQLGSRDLLRHVRADASGRTFIERAVRTLHLSARAYH